MTRADVLHRLAALEAVLQGPALEAPPGPTPEDLAQCRPWSVKVGNWVVHVVYEGPQADAEDTETG